MPKPPEAAVPPLPLELAGVVDSACWTSSLGCRADTLGGWYVWVCVTRSTVARGWPLGSRRSSLAGHLLRNHRHCVFTCHRRQQRLNWTKREKTRTKTRKQSSREEVVTSMCKGPCFAQIGLIDIYSGNSKLGHLYQDIDAWKHGKVICCSALQLQWLSVPLTVICIVLTSRDGKNAGAVYVMKITARILMSYSNELCNIMRVIRVFVEQAIWVGDIIAPNFMARFTGGNHLAVPSPNLILCEWCSRAIIFC